MVHAGMITGCHLTLDARRTAIVNPGAWPGLGFNQMVRIRLSRIWAHISEGWINQWNRDSDDDRRIGSANSFDELIRLC